MSDFHEWSKKYWSSSATDRDAWQAAREDLEAKLALAEGEWKTYAKMSDELSKKLAEIEPVKCPSCGSFNHKREKSIKGCLFDNCLDCNESWSSPIVTSRNESLRFQKEVYELEKKLAEANTETREQCASKLLWNEKFQKVDKKLALAVEALEFYQENTSDMWIDYADDWSDGVSALINDEGKRAREALKQIAE